MRGRESLVADDLCSLDRPTERAVEQAADGVTAKRLSYRHRLHSSTLCQWGVELSLAPPLAVPFGLPVASQVDGLEGAVVRSDPVPDLPETRLATFLFSQVRGRIRHGITARDDPHS